jgi:hypothetical protein
MPFDENDAGSYDKWGFDQLHEPRGVSMAGNWRIGDYVHVWIETPKDFDESLKVWQKGLVTGLADNGHRCFVKLRVHNEQREELEDEFFRSASFWPFLEACKATSVLFATCFCKFRAFVVAVRPQDSVLTEVGLLFVSSGSVR